jgi:hypothetical protein
MAATMKGWGFNRCYQLPIAAISWNDYHSTEKHKRKIRSIAKKFYEDVVSKKLFGNMFYVMAKKVSKYMIITYRK